MLNIKNFIMKKRTISEDIAKIVIISKAPEWAKMIVDAIPNLKYDDYLKNYRAIWSIALPASTFLVMRKYVKGELGKTFTAHMSAGIARAINSRAKTHTNVAQDLPKSSLLINKQEGLSGVEQIQDLQMKDCLYLLNSSELNIAMERISSLPEDQRTNLLASFVPKDRYVEGYFESIREFEKAMSTKIINLSYPKDLTKVDFLRLFLVDPTEQQFKSWASTVFDEKRKENRRRIAKKKHGLHL